MSHSNHYETLLVSDTATTTEIKQAYRRLVKQFHPDSHSQTADHEKIVEINAAYEVLRDEQRRYSYDRDLNSSKRSPEPRQQRAANVQRHYPKQWGQKADEHLELWLQQVYTPVYTLLWRILKPLNDEIDELSADPFDDELMELFQDYLNDCRQYLSQAQRIFSSLPNPGNVAGVAAHLYYCLNQVGDGIDELHLFTLNYDYSHLHTGQELFRIAAGLRREAREALSAVA